MAGTSVTIGVIGVGGVGGYFGGKLCRGLTDADARVWFVARGQHLEAIRRDGLSVSTSGEGEWTCRPWAATDGIETLPRLDLCLLCVKSFDLAGVLPRLADALSGRTIIIPLLNGVDAYERIREKVSDARILPACAYVGTHIESPGRIRQDGGACKIVLGKDPKAPHFEPEWVFDLFRKSGIKFEWRDDARPELWKKFMFISAFGLVTAASSRTLGGVMADGKSSGRARSIMREIEAVARAAGITLPDSIVEDSYNRVREFPFETKTSFQRDFERSDKPDERDLFAGTILRMGAQLGVPTPATRDTLDSLNGLKPLPPGYT